MKRIAFLLLIGLCVFSPNIKAQDSLSHWSAGLKGGFDYYRVTPISSKAGFASYIDNISWNFPGVFVEYTINPLVGFGGGVDYLTFDRNTVTGNTLDFSVFGSVNLANLLTPKRTGFWSNVNVYGIWGAGFGIYSNRLVSTGIKQSSMSPMVSSALNTEFKLSNSWALNLEAQYRYYSRQEMGGLGTTGVGGLGSDAFVATIGLRYKFGANSKKHVRNMSVADYFNITDKNNQLVEKRLKALENENNAGKDKIGKLENKLNAVIAKNDSNKLCMQKLKESLKGIPETSVSSQSGKIIVLMDVNFKFASSELTDQTKTILNEVALTLKMNPGWSKLNVAGHTDNIGSVDLNQKLSVKRANAVEKYLVSKGLSDSMITATGFGMQNPVSSNETEEGRHKNRRAELTITK